MSIKGGFERGRWEEEKKKKKGEMKGRRGGGDNGCDNDDTWESWRWTVAEFSQFLGSKLATWEIHLVSL